MGRRPETQCLDLELVRNDGSSVWAEVTASGMYDEAGKLIGALGVTRDVSRTETGGNGAGGKPR